MESQPCKFDGCDRQAKVKGYCARDYWKARHLSLVPTKRCCVQGCGNASDRRGMCPKHFLRVKKYGDANYVPARKPGRPRAVVRAVQRLAQKRARRSDPIQMILWAAKTKCRKRGIEFSIDRSDLAMPPCCPLLGIPLYVAHGRRGPNSPSIDRIDPSKGYIKGNVWIVSWRANHLKSNGTLEELKMLTTNLELKAKEMCLG